MVGDKDVVAPRPQTSALPDLGTCLQVAETFPLTEVAHQVDEAKLRQNISNELDAWVLGLIQVHSEVSHQDKVLAPESF